MMIFGLVILQAADFFHASTEHARMQSAGCQLHSFFSQFASLRENVVFVCARSLMGVRVRGLGLGFFFYIVELIGS